MSECTEECDVDLSDARLLEIERRANEATSGPWIGRQIAPVGQGACIVDRIPTVGWVAHVGLGGGDDPQYRVDATFIAAARTDVPALVAEVRRLRDRDAAWQRATGCGEPEQVHERTVRLCSCDGAILPQIGDEVDACWECDGLIKVTESDESADATDGAAS